MEHRDDVVGELLSRVDHVVLGLGTLLDGGYLVLRAVGEDLHEAGQLGVLDEGELEEHGHGVFGQVYRVAVGLAHLATVQPFEELRGEHVLGPAQIRFHEIAAPHHVEELIRSAKLCIHFHRHGVVPLQDGVDHFIEVQRLLIPNALLEHAAVREAAGR